MSPPVEVAPNGAPARAPCSQNRVTSSSALASDDDGAVGSWIVGQAKGAATVFAHREMSTGRARAAGKEGRSSSPGWRGVLAAPEVEPWREEWGMRAGAGKRKGRRRRRPSGRGSLACVSGRRRLDWGGPGRWGRVGLRWAGARLRPVFGAAPISAPV